MLCNWHSTVFQISIAVLELYSKSPIDVFFWYLIHKQFCTFSYSGLWYYPTNIILHSITSSINENRVKPSVRSDLVSCLFFIEMA